MRFLEFRGAAGRPTGARAEAVSVGVAICVLLLVVATSQASHLGIDTAGHTTVEQTVCAQDPAAAGCLPTSSRDTSAYYSLRLGPGQPYVAREIDPTHPVAQSGRGQRRRDLLYFSQLTDFQLADEESPARVEFLDSTSDQDPSQFANAAWRPQEALQPQMDDRAIHQINLLASASPVAQGDGSRAQMSLAITTGDSLDNQQRNEAEQVVELLEGGTMDPNSGSANSADYASCPPGTPGPAEAVKYTGVQDYGDYVEGPDPAFYDPNDPRGQWSSWPLYPGLMDRAEAPFQAEGLSVPSYVTLGNHDGLVQGNAAANRSFEDVATGCQKEVAPSQQFTSLASLTPAYLANLAQTDPTKVALVPPDPNRQFVSTAQYKALHSPPYANQADGHGFSFVDPAELSASNGAAAYYAWSPVPGFTFIALNTVGEGGIVNDHSSDGNIDDPQFQWLKRELQKASAKDELIVLFGHHAITSLNNPEPDEAAPACTNTDDGHGHDTNPGCDVDPRISTPVHLGEPSQRQPGDTTETLSELLLSYPHVISFVAGHSHVNQVLPYSRTDGSGGFWNIKTAAEADWPQQSRLIDVMDNHDGTLSLFGTVIDHASATQAPAPGTSATGLDVSQLASINRTFAYNDPQKGGGTGEGAAQDKNVELLLPNPRTPYQHPASAQSLSMPLVPAFKQCGTGGKTPNQTHAPPLSVGSCSPSSIGVAHLGGQATGVAALTADPGDPTNASDEADFSIDATITDVHAGSPNGSDYNPNAAGADMTLLTRLRITDMASGASGTDPATTTDTDFAVPVSCAPTAGPAGSDCSVHTSADALTPGTVGEGRRSVLQAFRLRVNDSGPNGVRADGDDRLFEQQGVFIP
jgi:hypothetical protein